MYERGFWKSGESRKAELDVLNSSEADEAQVDGIIEDDEDVEQASSETSSRYVRMARAACRDCEDCVWVPLGDGHEELVNCRRA